MVGLSSTQLWGYRVPDALTIASELGYDSVEVWAEHAWMHGDSDREIRERALALGLELTVHAASWDLNLTARNSGVRRTSLDQVVRSIEFASAIGAKMITVHPGRATLHGKDLDWHWELQVEAFSTLAEEGAQRQVKVNVELMEPIKKEFFTQPGDANRLLAAVNHPNLGVTFDVAHIPLDQDPAALLEALSRVDEVHISDSTPTKLHVPLGHGQIDFGPVLSLVARLRIPITIEGYEARQVTDLAVWNLREFQGLWARAAGCAPHAQG